MTDVQNDVDQEETQEWLDALDSVLERDGPERAHFLLETLIDRARRSGSHIPYNANTAYVNTIPVTQEARTPGDPAIEWRIRSIIRWNAMAMVVHANRENEGLGGHIASFGSAATLYDVGFNHFFHAQTDEHGGDLLFIQGHCAPGIYARAFLEGRLSEDDLKGFRQEVDGKGISSYPHPWLMPDFWQLPTVSMGLGPLMAIYQARFMHYLHNRELRDCTPRKVWCFCGDGEMDEPESMGAIGLAGRERLDNLIFVINCNLQRLDGPVRGNSKIIQEMEGSFRGAGWNVIKVIWGSGWDALVARDKSGRLLQLMEETVDGDYQTFRAKDPAYLREHFFGKYPETRDLVANMSDDDLWGLTRGGHDPHKVFAAYTAATKHKGQPTVILAKTVKGYGMGEAGEGKNITHQQKKMGEAALKQFRDRFKLPISDEDISSTPFYRPADDSPEIEYLQERRKALGGYLPLRKEEAPSLVVPELEVFKNVLKGSGERTVSTTMSFVLMLTALIRDKQLGPHIVPIVPDEARTFGMEGLFRQLGIYSSQGQNYTPQDAGEVAFYKESKSGQILEEGINEAGATASWIAAGTSYANHGVNMVPFYIYYSMFGFQRVGDLLWAAGDMQTRGFLLGGTAGRTTLNGEGLQHQDGHSHILASTIPNCIAWDPCYGYELAVIMHHGLQRMFVEQENVFFYIALMNENYQQPALPDGVAEDIIRGMYKLGETKSDDGETLRVQLFGSGTILREVEAAAELLSKDFEIEADIWSVTSFNELTREGHDVARWNMMHPTESPRTCHVENCLEGKRGPAVMATDYMQAYPEQIRSYLNRTCYTLGTDGFGRSDTREALRRHFEVNRYYVVIAALRALEADGAVDSQRVAEAIERYQIDPEKPNPRFQ